MKRYLRLYLHFVEFSFSRVFEFRFDFFFRLLMDVAYYLISIFFYQVLYNHTPYLGGWSEPQTMVFLSGTLFVDALVMALFANNLWNLPSLVNSGGLDYYLSRPVSGLFFLSLRDFGANSIQNVFLSLAFMTWALWQLPGELNFINIGIFILLLINGVFLNYAVRMILLLPVFWVHSARGLEYIYWTVERTIERPDAIFKGWPRKVLVSLLPFCLMASFPARVLFGQEDGNLFWHILVVDVCFVLGLKFFWELGLRSYSSASS